MCKSFNVIYMGTGKYMHSTAERLLEVGKKKGAKDFTEIARELGGSDQSATNWKKRGVPAEVMIEAAKIYGANVLYLRDGAFPIFVSSNGKSQAMNELLKVAAMIDDLGLRELIGSAKVLANVYPSTKSINASSFQ